MSNIDQDLIRDYFATSAPWLWDWQDDGEAVAWFDGATITFRPELKAVLTRLEPIGLPRFGAIILLLAACRDNWLSESSGRQAFLEHVGYFRAPTESYGVFVEVVEGLDRLHQLRAMVPYPAAKAELAAMVFEVAHYRWPAGPTSTVVQAFASELAWTVERSAETFSIATVMDYTVLLADMADLRPGLAVLDQQSLENRLQTGLATSIQPAPLPPGTAVRQLIQQLHDDDELGGVARLARLLLAAVQLPRPLFDPDELPVGGVTDITNRGALDRLMLTELAQDDLTLAVRIAMNEALYLRREPLPKTFPRQRFVLIDSGLRMWGVPRVFATAVAMAVAAQADKNLEVACWRADGSQIVPVDLKSVRGLTAHLAELDHHVHPGNCLPALNAAVDQVGVKADVMIVTTDEVLADPEFNACLSNSHFESVHLAAVDRDGHFRLFQRTRAGTKSLREARFLIADVLAPAPKFEPQLIDHQILPALPAIYNVSPFPLRMTAAPNVKNSSFVPGWNVVVTLTNDGRLLRWWEANRIGALPIAENLPAGELHYCSSGYPDGQKITLVTGRLSQNGLYCVQLDMNERTQSIRRLQLDRNQPRCIVMHRELLLIFFDKHVNALDPSSGSLLASKEHSLGWSRAGRFLPLSTASISSRDWAAFSCDGTSITVDVLRSEFQLVVVVDPLNPAQGPIGITQQGELVDLQSGTKQPLLPHEKGTLWELNAVSKDRLRLAFKKLEHRGDQSQERLVKQLRIATGTQATQSEERLVNLVTRTAEIARPNGEVAVNSIIHFRSHQRPIRTRFLGILIDEFARLTLVSKKGSLWPLTFCPASNSIQFPTSAAALRPSSVFLTFQSVSEESTGGKNLSMARWPDGSIAVLDRLGMLSLMSWDKSIPECTIVLTEGKTSGWVSDGRFWGERYFVAENTVTEAKEIWDNVIQRFVMKIQFSTIN